MKFKHHFKLEFDVKTNNADLLSLLQSIGKTVRNNLELFLNGYTEIEVLPTVTVIEDAEDEE